MPAEPRFRRCPEPHTEEHPNLDRARADLERRFQEIAAAYTGRPQPVVLDELERAVSAAGVTPLDPDLSSLARRIAVGVPAGH